MGTESEAVKNSVVASVGEPRKAQSQLFSPISICPPRLNTDVTGEKSGTAEGVCPPMMLKGFGT